MKDHVWTASELLASVFLGPIPPIEDWRLAWYRSEDEREEIRSGVMFARVKQIVAQLEAEDASAASANAVEEMLNSFPKPLDIEKLAPVYKA